MHMHDIDLSCATSRAPGLYNFAKSLEDLETGLLGGFFFGHFCLAANVIGSDARGTMQRAVSGLKRTYETPVFPRLDAVRWAAAAHAGNALPHMFPPSGCGHLQP